MLQLGGYKFLLPLRPPSLPPYPDAAVLSKTAVRPRLHPQGLRRLSIELELRCSRRVV
jgi:hypothetical protein